MKYANISTLLIWELITEISTKKELWVANALGDEDAKKSVSGDLIKLGIQYAIDHIMEELSELDDRTEDGDSI